MVQSSYVLLTTLVVIAASASATREVAARTDGDNGCQAAAAKCAKVLLDGNSIEDCAPLPIPQQAQISALRPEGYNVKEIRSNVYVVSEVGYQFMIIRSPRRFVVVDAPGSFIVTDLATGDVRNLAVEAVKEVMSTQRAPAKIDIVYSHTHLDHTLAARGLASFFKESYPDADLRIITSEKSAEALARTQTNLVPLATHTFRKTRTLRVGPDLEVVLTITGGAHAEEDILFHIPPVGNEPGVVMLVDVVFPGWAPFHNFAITEDVFDYIRVHDQVLALDFEIFVGGHLTRIGTRRDVEFNKKYTVQLFRAAQRGLAAAADPEVAAFNPESPYFSNIFAFILSQRRNGADQCVAEVFEKWACRVAGLDQVIRSHCLFAGFAVSVIDFSTIQ